jgi:tetratricopeptide (TPR) repeat protein
MFAEKTRLIACFLLLFACICDTVPAHSQTRMLTTKSKKAERYFMDAADFYNGKAYSQAQKALNKAIEEDPLFIEAYILSGDILAEEQHYSDALESYKKAIGIDPEFSPQLYYISANTELAIGRYKDAKQDYLRFLQFQGTANDKQTRQKITSKPAISGSVQWNTPSLLTLAIWATASIQRMTNM